MSIKVACPAAYQAAIANYRNPYRGAIGASYALSYWTIVDPVVANYDGAQFTIEMSPGDGYTFEYYVNPTPPPALPILGIDLTGLINADQIGSVTLAAIGALDEFNILANGPANSSFIVVQALAGSQGNTQIVSSAPLVINGFDIGDSSVFFFGGQSLSIPILWGPQRGMGPTTANTVQGFEGE